jgi:hypothetical protein
MTQAHNSFEIPSPLFPLFYFAFVFFFFSLLRALFVHYLLLLPFSFCVLVFRQSIRHCCQYFRNFSVWRQAKISLGLYLSVPWHIETCLIVKLCMYIICTYVYMNCLRYGFCSGIFFKHKTLTCERCMKLSLVINGKSGNRIKYYKIISEYFEGKLKKLKNVETAKI